MKTTVKNKGISGLRKLVLLIILLFPISHSLYPFPASLDEVLTSLKTLSPEVQFRWDPLFQEGVFELGDHSGSFLTAKEGDTGWLLYNNLEIFDVPLPYRKDNALIFPDIFVSTLKDAFAKSIERDASHFNVTTIVIDPGHGGKDSGAVGTIKVNGKSAEFYEKDIVLKAGRILKNNLNQMYPDKRILMTRETDVSMTLEQRADMANAVSVKDNEAVIFISIHANWSGKPNARGYEVWHINSSYRRSLIDNSKNQYTPDVSAILNAMLEEEYTTESILLADYILKGLGDTFGKSIPSRGRKANDWFVVRNSRMPAVLVELGFVTNSQDTALMTSEDGLNKFTDSLYKGIVNYITMFERP
jgi:N-acetylmuramoyl-L-alanine amidase